MPLIEAPCKRTEMTTIRRGSSMQCCKVGAPGKGMASPLRSPAPVSENTPNTDTLKE